MNGKLVGLLIRSNATLIEALSESARLADKDGSYNENQFWNLRQEVIAMAEEAEVATEEAVTESQIKIAIEQGAWEGFKQVRESFPPMIPISPAHEVEHQSEILHIQDADIGRVYLGKSKSTGQYYTARIEGVRAAQSSIDGNVRVVRTSMLTLANNNLTPFDRFISEPDFIKEFYRWIE